MALRTSSNMYVVETCNTKIIKSAIAKIFLSGLYLPAVPSSLRRVSRAVMALIPHAYPTCHDCQCIFPCVLFSFTRCLNSCHGNRKPGSEEGAFSHPQRNVDLSTPIPSTYACSRSLIQKTSASTPPRLANLVSTILAANIQIVNPR